MSVIRHKFGAFKIVPGTVNKPEKPKREEYPDISDADFAEILQMYEHELHDYNEAQKPHNGGTDDEHNGPGVTGWVNPDTVTGPGVHNK